MSLTFKEYLESKEQLRQAISQTPIRVVEYSVRKYCKIPLGESQEEKVLVSLKPKQKIIVEWLYEDINNPKPVNVTLESSSEPFSVYWQGWKLEKWLNCNTKEKSNEN